VTKIAKKISAYFYRNDNGKMPVREWILGFSPKDKKIIGEDIKTVEFGWPIGMPTVRPMGNKLFEVRSDLVDGSDVRIFFTIYKSSMILLHGYFKTTNKTPNRELRLARDRLKKFSKTQLFKNGGKNET
jgi:phage-related protein